MQTDKGKKFVLFWPLKPFQVNKFIKPFWFLTFFFTTLIFIYAYSNLDDMVSYYQNPYTGEKLVITRDTFFFVGLAVITLTNIALYAFSKLIRASTIEKEYFNELGLWFIAMAGISNAFFFISLIFIMLFNKMDNFNPSVLGYFLYLCGFIAMAWLVRLIMILVKK